jgi:hypothetical protein
VSVAGVVADYAEQVRRGILSDRKITKRTAATREKNLNDFAQASKSFVGNRSKNKFYWAIKIIMTFKHDDQCCKKIWAF